MPPQHIFSSGTSGIESIKFKLWGFTCNKTHTPPPPTVTSCTNKGSTCKVLSNPRFWSILFVGFPWAVTHLTAGLWLPCVPKSFLFFGTSESHSFDTILPFPQETNRCVSASWPGIKESKLLVRQYPRHRQLGWRWYFSKSLSGSKEKYNENFMQFWKKLEVSSVKVMSLFLWQRSNSTTATFPSCTLQFRQE